MLAAFLMCKFMFMALLYSWLSIIGSGQLISHAPLTSLSIALISYLTACADPPHIMRCSPTHLLRYLCPHVRRYSPCILTPTLCIAHQPAYYANFAFHCIHYPINMMLPHVMLCSPPPHLVHHFGPHVNRLITVRSFHLPMHCP